MTTDSDVEIPEDAPRWAFPLFVGGHLRDVRLSAIEKQCEAIAKQLAEQAAARTIALDARTIGIIIGTVTAILGGAFGISHIPTTDETRTPPAVEATP